MEAGPPHPKGFLVPLRSGINAIWQLIKMALSMKTSMRSAPARARCVRVEANGEFVIIRLFLPRETDLKEYIKHNQSVETDRAR